MTSTSSLLPRPRRSSLTIAYFLILQLLLISVAASRSFLPRQKPKKASTHRHRNANVDGNVFDRSSWLKLRGGSETDTAHHDEPSAAEVVGTENPLAPVPTIAGLEISTSEISDPSDKDGDGERTITMNNGDDEMIYATVGILNIPKTRGHGDNILLLSYKCNDDPTLQINEKWGVHEATTPVETELPDGYDATNGVALAEINGCLCHGIVLNLPKQMILDSGDDIFSSDSVASQHLDETFLCVAKGIIRRLKGTQLTTIPLSITFEGDGDDLIDDSVKENATKYMKVYFERALYHMWNLHVGKTQGRDHTTDEVSILQQCKVVVSFSTSSAFETATEMANTLLQQHSADETSKHNIVPRTLFGTLCTQVYSEIRSSWLSLNGHQNENSASWEKLSEDSQFMNNIVEEIILDTTIKTGMAKDTLPKSQVQPVSADLRRKVESLMAMAFVDAEDSLLEMENKMDDVFLHNGGDENIQIESHPMPQFGSEINAIVNAMSSSFLALLDENEPISESERDWVKDQRIQALEQVVRTSIRRLFHDHLQSLRDHFGHWYECMLESPLAGDFDTEGFSSQKDIKLRRQEAAQQAEEGFRKAAFASVPEICQHPEGDLCEELLGMFSCIEALRGLLEDMYEVTSTRGLEEEEWEDIMGESAEENSNDLDSHSSSNSRVGLRQLIKNMKAKIKKRGPAKWYERWAAKIFVIGVNYIQGWIVLQALRREATKRDLAMPKFPLF